MKIDRIYSGFVFTRNPIIYTGSPDIPLQKAGMDMLVSIGKKTIYSGRISSPVRVNLADVIDSNLEYFPEVPAENDYPRVLVARLEPVKVSVEVRGSEGDRTDPVSFYPIKGGIPKQNYRRLAELETDAFSSRFLNEQGNFFLTTRTNRWRITMKETEISPLYFIMDNGKNITVIEKSGNQTQVLVDDGPGVYALDIEALRRKFFFKNNILASHFDVFVEDLFSCSIVIEKADISRERYRLKFRNSFGFFDIIELTGELLISSASDQDQESMEFQRFDEIIEDFTTHRERLSGFITMRAGTGIKKQEEIGLLLDMLHSDKVYLLDLGERPIRVIPEIEELEFSPVPNKPKVYEVKLTTVESEENISQAIHDGSESKKPRVFSKQFSKQFN